MKTVVEQNECEPTAARSSSRTIAARVEIIAPAVMMIGTVLVNTIAEVLLQADLMIAALHQVDSVGVAEEVEVAVEDTAVVATKEFRYMLFATRRLKQNMSFIWCGLTIGLNML